MDVAKAVKEVKAGKIDFKVDKAGIIHAVIGKASFDAAKLSENAHELLQTLVKLEPSTAAKAVFFVPTTVVRDGAVFAYLNGRAVRRAVRVGGTTQQGLRIEEGLIGGEDLIVNPPAELKDGARVKRK